MTDTRREPIECRARPIDFILKPGVPATSSSNPKTSPIVEDEFTSSKSKNKSTRKPFRKRWRTRNPKSSFDVAMSNLSNRGVMQGEDKVLLEEAASTTTGHLDGPDSQHGPGGEVVPETGHTEVECVMITPIPDDTTSNPSMPEDVDSSSGDFVQQSLGSTLVNAATETLPPITRRGVRREPCECPPSFEETLPNPVTSSSSKDVIRMNSNFMRLNVALLSVLVHIAIPNAPSTPLSGSAMMRILVALSSGTVFFPVLAFVLFDPSSSKVSKWARNARLHLNTFWIRMWTLIFMVLIKILVVVEVFQHLPLWIGVFLLVIAVAAFVPFLVVVLVMNLLHENHKVQFNEISSRVVINVVYGSLIFVHALEMRPSLLSTVLVAVSPHGAPNSPILNIASLCFNLAIVLQLPALFLEASCVEFCNCLVGRRGNSAGVASLLLTVFFQMSLSSFLAAIGVTLFANGVSTLGFCLYVGVAVIFMIIVGCYQLDILPRTLGIGKQRVE